MTMIYLTSITRVEIMQTHGHTHAYAHAYIKVVEKLQGLYVGAKVVHEKPEKIIGGEQHCRGLGDDPVDRTKPHTENDDLLAQEVVNSLMRDKVYPFAL